TLVKDAQRHGVEVLSIDVTRSEWRTTIERRAERRCAVRIGLRFVRGLREDAATRLVAARRAAPFRDVADLARRSMLQRNELASRAELGALVSLGAGDRRAALWQVAGLPTPDERLFAGGTSSASRAELAAMSPLDETLADYRSSGMTTGPHVMAHLRPTLEA